MIEIKVYFVRSILITELYPKKMRGNIIRKLVIAAIILAPVISYTGCKKQAKCGCGKDVLRTIANVSANVYWTSPESITFYVVGNPYSTYYFCNPTEMYPNLKDAKQGDVLLVSGHVYWNCNYVYQASNSSYMSSYQAFDCQVTNLTLDLYGKGKPATGTPLDLTLPQN
jgi:hypothetical protein